MDDEATNPDQLRLTVTVRGRVQGVGFRYWTARQARELGLNGTAVNRNDGSVEVIVEGEGPRLDELVARLRSGAAPGRVDDVRADYGPARGDLSGFRAG